MKKLLATCLVALGASGTFFATPAAAQEPFLGEISFAGFNFAPRGWAKCDGQILPINSNQSLYSLLGTTYGGDGRTTFALPDARGRTLTHFGSNELGAYTLGEKGGAETAVMTVAQMPAHTHTGHIVGTASGANKAAPDGGMLASTGGTSSYRSAGAPGAAMKAGTLAANATGGGQAFSIMNPWVSATCIIALQGLFPSRN